LPARYFAVGGNVKEKKKGRQKEEEADDGKSEARCKGVNAARHFLFVAREYFQTSNKDERPGAGVDGSLGSGFSLIPRLAKREGRSGKPKVHHSIRVRSRIERRG
jgi:hypothetical protein